jgi:hypothetical protein
MTNTDFNLDPEPKPEPKPESKPSSVLDWVDELPPRARGGLPGETRYQPIMDELKANPGRWGVISDSFVGTPIGKGARDYLRKRGLQVAQRKLLEEVDDAGNARILIYARWPAPKES